MLTKNEKKTIESAMENEITANPNGINTRILTQTIFKRLHQSIPNMNMHHISGMLSWVYKQYGHTFLVRTPGYSVII